MKIPIFKVNLDHYLTHYWLITNGTLYDVVGGADMINVSLIYTTFDRFGNDNSALALNGGYSFIPSGVYLNTQEFSISYPHISISTKSKRMESHHRIDQ
jgi:hypothetical protein